LEGSKFKASLGKNLMISLPPLISTNKPSVVAPSNPNYMGGTGSIIEVRASPDKKHDLL
jgi:hypothetical protein